MRGARLSLLAGLALLLLGAAPLQAAPTAEERCSSRMAEASGRYLDCAMRENGRAAKRGRAANLDRCERKLGRVVTRALRRWGPEVCPSVNQVGGEATTLGDQLNGLVSQMSEAVGVSNEDLSDDAALCAAKKAKVVGQDLRCRAQALARGTLFDRPANEAACSERRLARKLARIEKKYGPACPTQTDANTLTTHGRLALSEVTDWVAPKMQRHAVAVDPPPLQTLPDADGDGLSDNFEIGLSLTDPERPDTDGDGRWDGLEVLYHGTDPTQADSDPEAPTKYKRPHSEGANLDHVYPGAWNSRIAGIPLMWDPESVYGNTIIGVASGWMQIICTFGNCPSVTKPTPAWATKGFAKIENGIAGLGSQITTLGTELKDFDQQISTQVGKNQQLLGRLLGRQIDTACTSAKHDFRTWLTTPRPSPQGYSRTATPIAALTQNLTNAFGGSGHSGNYVDQFFYDYLLSAAGTPQFDFASQLGDGYQLSGCGPAGSHEQENSYRCHIDKIRKACHTEAVYHKLLQKELTSLGADRIYHEVMLNYVRYEFGTLQRGLLFHATNLRAQAWFHADPDLRRTAFWLAMQEQKAAVHVVGEKTCSRTDGHCVRDDDCGGANNKCLAGTTPNADASPACPSHLRLMGTPEHGRCVSVSDKTCSHTPHGVCSEDSDCSGSHNRCVVEDWLYTVESIATHPGEQERDFTNGELVAARGWRALGSICDAWALKVGKPCEGSHTQEDPGYYCQQMLCEPKRSHCESGESQLCLSWRAGRNAVNAGLSIGEPFTNKTYTYEPTRGVLWLQDPASDLYVRYTHDGSTSTVQGSWDYLEGNPGDYQFGCIATHVDGGGCTPALEGFVSNAPVDAVQGGWPGFKGFVELLKLKPATRSDWMGSGRAIFRTNSDGMMSSALSGGAGNSQNNRRASFAPYMARGMYQKGSLRWPSYSPTDRPLPTCDPTSVPSGCRLKPADPSVTPPAGADRHGNLACAAGWRLPDLLWMGSYQPMTAMATSIGESWGYRWNTDASRTALGECRTTAAQYFMYPHLRIEHEYSMSDVAYAVGKNDTFCGSEACDQNYADNGKSPTTLRYGAWPGAPSYEGDHRAKIEFGLSCNWLTKHSVLRRCEQDITGGASQFWDGRACEGSGSFSSQAEQNWTRKRKASENSLSFEVDSACNHRHDILSWVHSSSDFRKTTLTIGQDSCKWPPSFGYTWLGDYQVPYGSYDAFDIRCRSMDGGNGLNSVWGLTKRDTCLLPIINSGASLPLTHSTEFISHPVQPPCCNPDRCDSSDCWGIALPVACADSAKAGEGCDGRGSATYETFRQCLNFSDAPNCAHLGVQSPYLIYGPSNVPSYSYIYPLVTPGGVASQVEMVASYATNAFLRDGKCGATPSTEHNQTFRTAKETPFLAHQPDGHGRPEFPMKMWPTIDLLSPAGPDFICPGAQDWTAAKWTEREHASQTLTTPVSKPPANPVTTFQECVHDVILNITETHLEPACERHSGDHEDGWNDANVHDWCHRNVDQTHEIKVQQCRKTCAWVDRCKEAQFIAENSSQAQAGVATPLTAQELYTRVVRKSASAFQATKKPPSSCCSNAMCENTYEAPIVPLLPSLQAGWRQPLTAKPDHICTAGTSGSWSNPGRVYQDATVYKVDGVQECVSQCGSDCEAVHYNATWCTVFKTCDHTVPYPYGGTLYHDATTLARMKSDVSSGSKTKQGNPRAIPPGALYGNRPCMGAGSIPDPSSGEPLSYKWRSHEVPFTACVQRCSEDADCHFFSYAGASVYDSPSSTHPSNAPAATCYGEKQSCRLYYDEHFFYTGDDVSVCADANNTQGTWADAPEGWAVWARPKATTWSQDWDCTRPGATHQAKQCSRSISEQEIDSFLNLGLLSAKNPGGKIAQGNECTGTGEGACEAGLSCESAVAGETKKRCIKISAERTQGNSCALERTCTSGNPLHLGQACIHNSDCGSGYDMETQQSFYGNCEFKGVCDSSLHCTTLLRDRLFSAHTKYAYDTGTCSHTHGSCSLDSDCPDSSEHCQAGTPGKFWKIEFPRAYCATQEEICHRYNSTPENMRPAISILNQELSQGVSASASGCTGGHWQPSASQSFVMAGSHPDLCSL